MTQLSIFGKQADLAQEQAAQDELRPMPFWLSLLLFGVPALIFVISFHFVIPALESLGLSAMESFLTAAIVPTSWLFVAALVGYHKIEGRPLSRSAFSRRMRYPRLRFKDLLLGFGVYIVGLVGVLLLTQIVHALIDMGLMPLPQDLPIFIDPRTVISGAALDQATGGTMQGQWGIVVLYLVYLFFNIAGEELWWRGYILPRQELRHGDRTWMVHGVLWALFHAFKWWDILAILPLCLIMAFSAQRLKNNWPAAIAHLLGNLSFFLLIVAGVMGLI